MKNYKSLISGFLFLLITLTVIPVFAADGRDCDSNAIVYCGAYSVKELTNKMHDSWNITSFYKTIGIKEEQFGNLKEGIVKKDGTVWVDNKQVASNVYSSGRKFMNGSVRDSRFSDTFYWRHPSVSFRSDSIGAFVYLNYDGSFGYAIIKSCGNPVTLNYSANVKHKITVNKFEDKNGDKHKQSSEDMLSNWAFKISGNGVNTSGKTNSHGALDFNSLSDGTYTITEEPVSGWTTTTLNPQTVILKGGDAVIWFGNKKNVVPIIKTYNLNVKKFHDINGNKKKDGNEPFIQNWEFRITGNGVDKKAKTGNDGVVSFTNLKKGTYTIEETGKAGWINTLPGKRKQTIELSSDMTVLFGNRRVFSITVRKFNDLDGDKVKDQNEGFLQGWEFNLKGNGINKKATTNKDGQIVFGYIPEGNYTVTESLRKDWISTGKLTRDINVNGNEVIYFGNKKKKKQVVNTTSVLSILKFNDLDGDKAKDENEEFLSGWEFTLSGNGKTLKATTDQDGRIYFPNLSKGEYKLKETLKPEWVSTTGEEETVIIQESDDPVILVGNRLKTMVQPEGEEVGEVKGASIVAGSLPQSGPEETAAMAFSASSLAGGIYTWLRSKRRLLKTLKGL